MDRLKNNGYRWACFASAVVLVIIWEYIYLRLNRYQKLDDDKEYVFDKWKGEYYNVRNKIYYTDIPLNNY